MRKGLKDDLLQLQAIDQHIAKHLRFKFFNLPGHGNIVHELQALNSSFVPILNYMVCYKSEIGLALQRMVESYNILILMQFEGFYSEDHHLKQEYSGKVKQLDERLKEISALKEQLKHEQFMMQQLILSKEKDSKQLNDEIAFLKKQINELKAFIHTSKMKDDPNGEKRA